jgi:hypothetical protein
MRFPVVFGGFFYDAVEAVRSGFGRAFGSMNLFNANAA